MNSTQPDDYLLEPDRLLTILEVAAILRISRSLIYMLIARGELPTVRINRALRFRSQDVQDYIHRSRLAPSGKRRGKKEKE